MKIDAVMRLAPVIPVIVIDDAANARPRAEALVAAGHRALEVTLRTPAAIAAIAAMARVEGGIAFLPGIATAADIRLACTATRRLRRRIVDDMNRQPDDRRSPA